MRVAVASGKGGTGKTTVVTNLALAAAAAGQRVVLLDCDVEEPNAALFLAPEFVESEPVLVGVPEVDASKCTSCGRCARICQYGAIVALGEKVAVLPELCRGCGGCWLVCPAGAITAAQRPVGRVERGWAGEVYCVQGALEPGQTLGVPVIAHRLSPAPYVDLRVDEGDVIKIGNLRLTARIWRQTNPGTVAEETAMINTECRRAGIGCVDCKRLFAKNLNHNLDPFRQRRNEFAKDPELVQGILSEGKDRAQAIARQTIREVKQAIGLLV